MKKLTPKELGRAIDFIIEYDIEGAMGSRRGLHDLLRYGCVAYGNFTQIDIEEFLIDNDHLTLNDLIN
jgi:hypothetical protein